MFLVIAMVMAACGGGDLSAAGDEVEATATATTAATDATADAAPSATTGAGTAAQDEPDPIAFAGCMRANGVPDFPDPVPGRTGFRISGDIASNPNFETAMGACEHLRPAGGATAGLNGGQADNETILAFASCMRVNGVPAFPDPGSGVNLADLGINTSSPVFQTALETCEQETGLRIMFPDR